MARPGDFSTRGRLQDRLIQQAAVAKNRDRLVEKMRTMSAVRTANDHSANGSTASNSLASPADRRFRLTLKRFDQISILSPGGSTRIPQIGRTILQTLLQSTDRKPVCILLPSTESIPEFTAAVAAIECLAVDYPERKAQFIDKIVPGTRVRALPDGNIYVSGERRTEYGNDGIYLHYTEKDSRESNGRHWIRIDELLRYEPTARKLPISRSTTRLSLPRPNLIDELANVRTFGNSALHHTRVVLVGARAHFDQMLAAVDLVATGARTSRGELRHCFAWGALDDSGQPYVTHPSGSEGTPLVAIAADFERAEKAALSETSPAGSQFLISDRLDLALRSLDLVNRIAERQRVVLLVDARRRQDIIPLRRHSWHLWEPEPNDLLPDQSEEFPASTGIAGLDQTLRCALAERNPKILYANATSPSLNAAFASLRDVGDHLQRTEAATFDDRVQASLETAANLFFRSSDELSAPSPERSEEYVSSIEHLRREIAYIGRYFGAAPADAMGRLARHIEAYLSEAREAGLTPKGRSLIEQARARPHSVFVTGNGLNRERATAFFGSEGIPNRCLQLSELSQESGLTEVTAFSIMGRERFASLVDPWPSQDVIFVGYDFENDIYRRRLKLRSVQRRNLRLSDEERFSITCHAPMASRPSPIEEVPTNVNAADDPVGSLDAVVAAAQWDWSRRFHIPRPSAGETTLDARIIRFAGRSWMPATEEHRLLCLRVSPGKNVPGVGQLLLEEIQEGSRILVREGGEKDVIRTIARQICGAEKYDYLRLQAGLWRDALQTSGLNVKSIAKALSNTGVRKHTATIRGWLMDDARIGPRRDDDVATIAATFPLPGKTPKDWKNCCDAISQLRGLHLSAGAMLTDQLFNRCGSMLLEPTETEIAVEFDLGVVWILTAATVEPNAKPCPVSIINRVQWLDPSWRDRLLEGRLRGS